MVQCFLRQAQTKRSLFGTQRLRRPWQGRDLSLISLESADWSRYDFPRVINAVWHPSKNIVSFVTSEGELYIHPDFLQSEAASLLDKRLQPSPFIRDALAETDGNARRIPIHNAKDDVPTRTVRKGTPDSLDDILGPELDGDDDDFVIDDDGAGYTNGVNGYGKRNNEHLDDIDEHDHKRRPTNQAFRPRLHQSFQPGSTPWRGNRKYLCKQPAFVSVDIC